MMAQLQETERWLMLRMNREWTSGFLDHLLPTLSSFAAWTPLIIIGVIWGWWRGGFRARAFIVCATLAALLCEGLLGGPLKKTIGRVRPCETLPEVVKRTLPGAKPQVLALFRLPDLQNGTPLKPAARGRSFPSSHTVNMFAVAAVALFFYGRRAWIFPLVAALVAWSRVYCGVHWPGDILGSIPLGLMGGAGTVFLASKIWTRYGGRVMPSVHAQNPVLPGGQRH